MQFKKSFAAVASVLLLVGLLECQQRREHAKKTKQLDDLLNIVTDDLRQFDQEHPGRAAKRVTDTRVVAGKVTRHHLNDGDLYMEITEKTGVSTGFWIVSRTEILTILPRLEQSPKSLQEWLNAHKHENCCGSIGFKNGTATNAIFVIDN